MRGRLSFVLRLALGGCACLLCLALARWGPVHAEVPVDVRALPLAGPTVLLAVAAALAGGPRRRLPVRPVLVSLAVAAAALAGVVVLRGPAGLAAEVRGPEGVLGRLSPGPIDVAGPDLDRLPAPRRRSLAWEGPVRAPATGTYRLWAKGRGSLEVRIDGRPVLRGSGDPLRVGADVLIGRGEHHLEVRLSHSGPGARLRLGWRRPTPSGEPGDRSETIPLRLLGPPLPRAIWLATDALALLVATLVGWLVFAAPWEQPRELPAPGRLTRVDLAWSLAGHTALVLLMSWPLPLDLAGSGMVDRPDGRLNAWILAWDAHALLHDPASLFQAPIFHPLPDALAFSENLLVPAVLAAPATLLGGPVLGYNLALLGSFIFSGLGAQLLARRVSGDRLACFVGGAVFAVGAHRWIRLAHLHAQVTLFLPLALLALDRFWERRSLRRGLVVGLLLALQGASSVYLGAITATALATATGLAVLGGLRARELVRLLAGFLLAALLLAPLVRPYLRMRAFQGVEFTLADLSVYAATIESYVASGSPLYGPLTRRHLDPGLARDTLFPGVLPLALGLAGLAVAPRRYRAVFLGASAVAMVFSLGPETPVYRWLHEHVVLVRGIRALARFSLIPVLGLSVLSGLALSGRRRLTLLALPLLLAESAHVPLHYAKASSPPEAARWLAGGLGAVAYLPLGERDTEAMLDGVAHFRPLLNGDSGFIPRPYDRAMELLEDPLSPDGLRLLRAVGVRHVVSERELPLPVAVRCGPETVYEVTPGEAARVVAPGRPADSVWEDDGILVDLRRPRAVRSVSFAPSGAPWVAFPRVSASSDGERWEELIGQASLADATLSLMRDPVGGLGEVRFPPVMARYLKLDASLPAQRRPLGVGP